MRPSTQHGSALILALIVVTAVSILSVGMLRMMGAMTSRQEAATADRQAFYLAEAGLSEAVASLATGGNGNVGSLEQPAMFGGGLVFVEAIEPAEGEDPDLLTLRSTGMYARGRSTLEVVLRRVEKPFGIFADEDISFTEPFLVDGYDSETSPYFEQAGLPALVVDSTLDLKWAPEEKLLYYDGWYYEYESFEEPGTFYWLLRYQDYVSQAPMDSDEAALGLSEPMVEYAAVSDGCLDPQVILADARTAEEIRLAAVSPFGVDRHRDSIRDGRRAEPCKRKARAARRSRAKAWPGGFAAGALSQKCKRKARAARRSRAKACPRGFAAGALSQISQATSRAPRR